MKKSKKVTPEMVSFFVKANKELIQKESGLDIRDYKTVKHYLEAIVFRRDDRIVGMDPCLFQVLLDLYFRVKKYPYKDFT